MTLTPRQTIVLIVLTLVWGLNWPVMKVGASQFPPLSFRAISMWLGLPVLGAALVAFRMPLRVPRSAWRELVWLTLANMLVWNVFAMLALSQLSSGRAAILGYTMPVFAALWGPLLFGERLKPRAMAGVGAAALGVVLLLWHEMAALSGRPVGATLMLCAAASWAFGTHLMRRTQSGVPTLTLCFWMTALSAVVMTALGALFERHEWRAPSSPVWGAVVYNALLIFGYAQPAWLFLARTLPPVASSLSVMLIPVLGLASGALWLGETLHWQDFVAVALLLVAIASVLWPARGRSAESTTATVPD
jgi:drug/metabolite transporter (DMT)-like permease